MWLTKELPPWLPLNGTSLWPRLFSFPFKLYDELEMWDWLIRMVFGSTGDLPWDLNDWTWPMKCVNMDDRQWHHDKALLVATMNCLPLSCSSAVTQFILWRVLRIMAEQQHILHASSPAQVQYAKMHWLDDFFIVYSLLFLGKYLKYGKLCGHDTNGTPYQHFSGHQQKIFCEIYVSFCYAHPYS